MGTAIGMAMNGLRPVVEMQFDAFAYPAFEQVVSHVAKMGNRTRGARAGCRSSSASPTAAASAASNTTATRRRPTTPTPPASRWSRRQLPQDAYSLLRAALRHPDPVVFLEPKKLYWAKGEVDPGVTATIGKAAIVRAGTDVTLIAYGTSVPTAISAADAAAAEGRSVQVVDVRTLSPFDDDHRARRRCNSPAAPS